MLIFKPVNETGSVQIIAGKFKGRSLPVLAADGLRPTSGRVRKMLFSWLEPFIEGRICLDAFAGSGGLGFEALSRGAKSVLFLEKELHITAQLKKNSEALGRTPVQILCVDTLSYLFAQAVARNSWDLLFLDPPFNAHHLASFFEGYKKNDFLAANAFIYIESADLTYRKQLPKNWFCYKEVRSGRSYCALYKKVVSVK